MAGRAGSSFIFGGRAGCQGNAAVIMNGGAPTKKKHRGLFGSQGRAAAAAAPSRGGEVPNGPAARGGRAEFNAETVAAADAAIESLRRAADAANETADYLRERDLYIDELQKEDVTSLETMAAVRRFRDAVGQDKEYAGCAACGEIFRIKVKKVHGELAANNKPDLVAPPDPPDPEDGNKMMGHFCVECLKRKLRRGHSNFLTFDFGRPMSASC